MTDWHTAKPMNDFQAQLLMQHKLHLMRERVPGTASPLRLEQVYFTYFIGAQTVSNYQTHWDLSTVPVDKWASENGRRQRAKAPARTYVKLAPCKGCKYLLTAVERRLPRCPYCDIKQKRSNA